MILYILFALFCAKLKGYKIKPIFKAYSLYPFAIVELLYMLFQLSIFLHNYDFIQYANTIKRVYMYTLLIPIFVYKLYKPGIFGSAIIVIGTLLNKFVMIQNGGKMPVYASLSKITGYFNQSAIQTVDNIHILGNKSIKFKFLTDYIDIGYSIMSIGDLLIHSFIFVVIFYTIKEINKNLKYSYEK